MTPEHERAKALSGARFEPGRYGAVHGMGADSATEAATEAAPCASAAPAPTRSSFHMAMRLLPAGRRAAMFEVYAFCRAVDDVADGDAPAAEKCAALERWRADVHACCAGRGPGRLAPLQGHIAAFGLARDDFDAVIDGMLMDSRHEPMCAPGAATLDLYCDRVASAVGRLSVKIFGMPHDDGVLLAHHLGRALQLTNILRDIDEDAAIGRAYLPRELLLEAGVALDGGAAGIAAHPALPRACERLALEARAHFDEAARVMRRHHGGCVRAPRLMGAVYQALLARLLARGWVHPRAAVKVGKLARVGILLRHAVV